MTGRTVAVEPGLHPGRDWDSSSWVCDPTLAGELARLEGRGRPGRGTGPLLGGGAPVTPGAIDVPVDVPMDVAVVTPVYGNQDTLEELVGRLDAALAGRRWRLRFVVDGSPDGSLAVARALAAGDDRLAVTDLRENVGQHRALTRGLAEEASAHSWVCLDADLQDPPEAVPVLLDRLAAGDVGAVFAGRRGQLRGSGQVGDGPSPPAGPRPDQRPAARRRGVRGPRSGGSGRGGRPPVPQHRRRHRRVGSARGVGAGHAVDQALRPLGVDHLGAGGPVRPDAGLGGAGPRSRSGRRRGRGRGRRRRRRLPSLHDHHRVAPREPLFGHDLQATAGEVAIQGGAGRPVVPHSPADPGGRPTPSTPRGRRPGGSTTSARRPPPMPRL